MRTLLLLLVDALVRGLNALPGVRQLQHGPAYKQHADLRVGLGKARSSGSKMFTAIG